MNENKWKKKKKQEFFAKGKQAGSISFKFITVWKFECFWFLLIDFKIDLNSNFSFFFFQNWLPKIFLCWLLCGSGVEKWVKRKLWSENISNFIFVCWICSFIFLYSSQHFSFQVSYLCIKLSLQKWKGSKFWKFCSLNWLHQVQLFFFKKKKDQRDSMSAFYSSFYELQFDFYIGLNFLFKLFELLLVFAWRFCVFFVLWKKIATKKMEFTNHVLRKIEKGKKLKWQRTLREAYI